MYQSLHSILKFLLTIFFLLFFTLCLPILYPLLLIPILSYRYLVICCAKLFRREDLVSIVEPLGSILGAEDVFCSEHSFTELVALEMDSSVLDIESLRELTLRNVVDAKAKDGSGDQLLYPELRQTITEKYFMGFAFWCKVKDFSVDDHVRFLWDLDGFKEYAGKTWNQEKDLSKLIAKVAGNPWRRGRPLWELVLVPNIQLEEDPLTKSLIIFRMHHCLGDGLCILRIVPKIGGYSNFVDDYFQASKASRAPISSFRRFGRKCMFYARIPFQLSRYLGRSIMDQGVYTMNDLMKIVQKNPVHVKGKKDKDILQTSFSKRIPLELIKSIKNDHGVSFTSVVLGAMAGGLRQMLLKNMKEGEETKLPRFIPVGFTAIIKGHMDKMQNHVCIFAVNLPIREPNAVKRLKELDRKMRALSTSGVPLMSYIGSTKLVGLLPTALIRFVRKRTKHSAIGSVVNLLGPNKPIIFNGDNIMGLRTGLNPPGDIQGYAFQFITYTGHGRLMVSGRSSCWPSSSIDDAPHELIQYCENSFKDLQGGGYDNESFV